MSKTNAWETEVLQYVFEAVESGTIMTLLNAGKSGTLTNNSLYVSLHTADPGETGTQTTSESAYTGYSRQAVARNNTGSNRWTVSGDTADNTDNVDFGQKTGGSDETVTHFGIGTASSGAGALMYKGALTSSLSVTNGIEPRFSAGNCNITED